MIYRFIPAKWTASKQLRPFEGSYTYDEALAFNERGYNVYYFPNHPSDEVYDSLPTNERGRKRPIKGSDVNVFEWVFVDMDLKDGHYPNKDAFLEQILSSPGALLPTKILDTGNGIHAYWRVNDLEPKTFLRLARRLSTTLHTDPAVCTLNQLMRVPNTLNVKAELDWKLCELLWDEPGNVYTSEDLHRWLPPISPEDEEYCVRHYDSVYQNESALDIPISEELPVSFLALCRRNAEVKELFYGSPKDRSVADFRLGHLLQSAGLTRDEALIVLMQTAKASERTKVHRFGYANNIVDKIYTVEATGMTAKEPNAKEFKLLSRSVLDITQSVDTIEATRFPCDPMVDATDHGFRLTEVLGLIGGQGNGKTTTALNFFRWFIENNPEYVHLFVSLEQPENEIAERWLKMTQKLDPSIHAKVHILGNYNDDGSYRDLSLLDIQEYGLAFEKHTGLKIGSVVIDHIGVLRQEKGTGEFAGLVGICQRMKSFAVTLNCFMIMQSQTSREKNGIGDIELDLDAAYGTSNFESFCDYVITTWQPLKRVYEFMEKDNMLLISAFKMCKIRKKDVIKDKIKADKVYAWAFDPESEHLKELTSDQYKRFEFWSRRAATARGRDRKQQPTPLSQMEWVSVSANSSPSKS